MEQLSIHEQLSALKGANIDQATFYFAGENCLSKVTITGSQDGNRITFTNKFDHFGNDFIDYKVCEILESREYETAQAAYDAAVEARNYVLAFIKNLREQFGPVNA
ncbi:MAG: hypothetical protein PUC53_01815 [Bacteroidales bacterium]|nr:hypothetical protein [Bacteroidales bacterium]